MPVNRLSDDDFAHRIGTAIGQGLAGNMTAAADEIHAVVANGIADTYATICALAHIAVAPYVGTTQEGEFYGPLAVHHGQAVSIDDAPPAIRFAMRFMAAQANQDWDTSVALFKAGIAKEGAALAEAVAILLETAIATERVQLDLKEAGRADG